MENEKPDMHGLCLSGGGADGAYQVGVLKALLNGKTSTTYGEPMDPAVFTGTSVGSFNASFLVSQWAEYGAAAVGNLEKFWLEKMAWHGPTNGGFRVRLNPFELMDPREYLREPFRFRPLTQLASDLAYLGREAVDRVQNLVGGGAEPVLERVMETFNLSSFIAAEPWERTIRESIDFNEIREARKQLRIAATNWAKGEVREFRNRDMTDKLGPAAIRASSAVPGVYPPADVGSQKYVDGAVLMNTPLKPAIDAMREIMEIFETGIRNKEENVGDLIEEDPWMSGVLKYGLLLQERKHPWVRTEDSKEERLVVDPPDFVLHVVYMNAEVEKMPIAALQSTLKTLYRQQIISWAAAVNRDIEQARLLNQGLAFLGTVGELNQAEDKIKELKQELEGEAGTGTATATQEELKSKIEVRDKIKAKMLKLTVQEQTALIRSAQGLLEREQQGRPYRQLTIHRYFPPDGLDGALGFLDVREHRLARLIAEGFNDTVSHDCITNKCILAGKHEELGRRGG